VLAHIAEVLPAVSMSEVGASTALNNLTQLD